MNDNELDEIYSFALQLGKRGGEMLMEGVKLRSAGVADTSEHVQKENAVDLVTETDELVEAYIKQSISAKYPDHKFVGEESYAKGSTRDYLITEKPTWCVDPLDGTVNYIHLFPMFCVSIAFLVDRRPVIGVINAPFLGQTFASCKGKGAWLNCAQRLPLISHPMPPRSPSGCVFSCEWGKDRRDTADGNMSRKVNSFINMAAEIGGRNGKGGMVHGMRSLGSATLDLAYTAMGSFDIWWEGGCWEW